MEENKNNIKKLNNAAEDLPEVKRDINGNIDLDEITLYRDEKNNRVIPDEILNSYYRELPKGIINESGTWRANGIGGKLKIFGADIEEDREIQSKGGKVLQAALKQQRTFAEAFNTILAQKADKRAIEELNLKDNADNLDLVIAAALKQAGQGNVKAMEYIRDTIGQKPTEKIDASLSAMTPEQQKILEDIKAFNSNT